MNKITGKKIVITGGAGFIGSNLAHKLQLQNNQIIIIDSPDTNTGHNLINLEGCEYELINSKISNIESWYEKIQDADIIFNLAGRLDHKYSVTSPTIDLKDNYEEHVVFLNYLAKNKFQGQIIQTGSRSEFGNTTGIINENTPKKPTDPNGINIAARGQFLKLFAKIYDLKFTLVLLPNVFGPRHQMSNPFQGVLNHFVKMAILDQSIEVWGKDLKREVLYVDNCVEFLIRCAEDEKFLMEEFVLGGSNVTLYEFATLCVESAQTGNVILKEMDETISKIEVGDIQIDDSKARNLTADLLNFDLRDSILKTVEFYKNKKGVYF